MPERLNYEDSCRFLQREGWLKQGELPQLPERPPRYDDEQLGLDFFRTFVQGGKFAYLTLPRTYFGRSEIKECSFEGTDLSESVANWNDFEDVDFSHGNLRSFDFRGCMFRKVKFCGALLADADFRHCGLENCDFKAADLTGTLLTREVAASTNLSPEQKERIAWQDEDGPEPGGG